MKCSVYIASSVDGFIARSDDGIDWLDTAGNQDADMGDSADMGFTEFFDSVDCLIMGRKCMEVIAGMELTPEQWPYGDKRIIALSNTVHETPENLPGTVEMFGGDVLELLSKLEQEGHSHAYIDGGQTIQSFLDLKLISEMTLTYIPILLGEGIRLFGKTNQDIDLQQSSSQTFPNDLVQVHYHVSYG